MLVENPSNSLEWMIFLAQKYASMFIKGTWLTLEIAVIGTLVGFVLGYIVGLVNDAKISEGDNVFKNDTGICRYCGNSIKYWSLHG